ncbi:PLP-dependent aminotransferase family protein [Streptomyces sp. G5(2025)]|uniref:aminotransferase-like domain-containing protein n=1 Tax=Streptomyces sp. G5(2025) TaxID=3406628 RepID=UPI003C254A9F
MRRRRDFRELADEVAREIEAGALRGGERLPTQRAFARRRGIAVSTAIRVYGELARRGLVVGEVGRGTFVRAAAPHPGGAALTEGPPRPPGSQPPGLRSPDVRSPDVRSPGLRSPDVRSDVRSPGLPSPDVRSPDVRSDVRSPGLPSPDVRSPGSGPGPAMVNLELNYPLVEGQSALMARALGPLARADVLLEATRPAAPDGTAAAREAAATVLARSGWRPDAGRLLFAGNGRQAIAAALSSLVRPGGRVGVEEVTYPLVRAIAEQLGVRLVPIAVDEQGMLPDALAAAHRTASLAAVYVQPTLQNPLSVTAGAERRARLAAVIRDLGCRVVEDGTWGFLAEDAPAPLAALLPERVIFVDSLSKRVAPGLTLGMLAAPADHLDALARSLRSGGWAAGAFALEAAVRWVGDGTVETLVAAKRADVEVRHGIVRERLIGPGPGPGPGAGAGAGPGAGAGVKGRFRIDPRSYYCWWELPPPWRAETFVAAAAARGIAVTPGPAFAADGQRAGQAVRIGLASPPTEVLAWALDTLVDIAVGEAG